MKTTARALECIQILKSGTALQRGDLYDIYRDLRDIGPIYSESDNTWTVARYADARAALQHPASGTSLILREHPRFDSSPRMQSMRKVMLWIDDHRTHAVQRRLLSRVFTPKGVSDLGQFVQEYVEELAGELTRREEFDYLEEFATMIPVAVICRLLGVPREDFAVFREWTAVVTAATGPAVTEEHFLAADEASSSLQTYVKDLLQKKRTSPAQDLLSDLVALQSNSASSVDADQAVALAVLLLAAGSDTTSSFIAGAFLALNEDRENRQVFLEQSEFRMDHLDELLRFVSPVHFAIPRVITEPLDLPSGGRAEPGSRVWALLASANRDPHFFPAGDRLSLESPGKRHLAFAAGIHTCLGANLARMEALHALNYFIGDEWELLPAHGWRDHGNLREPINMRIRRSPSLAAAPAGR